MKSSVTKDHSRSPKSEPPIPRNELPVPVKLDSKLPSFFEDEGLEMGESLVHFQTIFFLYGGLGLHFTTKPGFQLLGDMNLYYSSKDYVSPDIMVVQPPGLLPASLRSYEIGQEGPCPLLVLEVLSYRTFQQGDLSFKPKLYADLGVAEYIVVDVTGDYLPQRILLKRLQPDGTWVDEQDKDGGVTSNLGFRIILEPDGQVRVVNAKTGEGYARLNEAQAEANARRQAEEKVRKLEAKLKQLRSAARKTKKKKPPTKRRRKS